MAYSWFSSSKIDIFTSPIGRMLEEPFVKNTFLGLWINLVFGRTTFRPKQEVVICWTVISRRWRTEKHFCRCLFLFHSSVSYFLFFLVRKFSGSNLSPETGCPDWGYSWFSSVHPGKCRNRTLNQATSASVHSLFHPIHAERLYSDSSTANKTSGLLRVFCHHKFWSTRRYNPVVTAFT
jgi:hypothetical protein